MSRESVVHVFGFIWAVGIVLGIGI